MLVALLAASEAALAATNRVRLRHLLQAQASPEDQGAAALLSSELSGDAQRFIATVTIAANVPLLGAAALCASLARRHFGLGVAVLIGALAAVVSIACLQIAPRFIVSQPGALDRLWWVRPARLLVALLRPPVSLLMAMGTLILRPLGLVPSVRAARSNRARNLERARSSEAEDDMERNGAAAIRDLVESAQASGVIEESGKELIESIFTFGDTRVREVMIPRPDILALPVETPAGEVLKTMQESGFSRVPLHEGTTDRIAGVLHVKDVLGALSRHEYGWSAQELMRPALFVPESQKIDDALASMRSTRTHIAIVMDEYGGTAGLLTVEDILEELVGEIADEHDRRADNPLHIIDPNTALVEATFHTDDLEDEWDLALPIGEFDTVGGFMIEQLGRALSVGDRVEAPDAVLTVQSVRARRPQKILITRKARPRKTEVTTEATTEATTAPLEAQSEPQSEAQTDF